MIRNELLEKFADDGPEAVQDNNLSLSSHLIRVPSRRLAAIASDTKSDVQLHGLLDTIHWRRWGLGDSEPVTFCWMSGESDESLVEPLSTLCSVLPADFGIQVQRDFLPFTTVFNPLDADAPRRLEQLRLLEQTVPSQLHREIEQQLGDPCFRWVRTLTSREWTGRVDGLRVCRLDDQGCGVIQIGAAPEDGVRRPEQEWFHALAGSDLFEIRPDRVAETVRILRGLVDGRRRGLWSNRELEHLLEARVLRRAVPIEVESERIEPVTSQFPTRWAESGAVRYIDVLGRTGSIPWVVELKVQEGGGAGQYFRHAIGQAVLYREFIRRSEGLAPWFQERGMDHRRCEAVVAMPRSEVSERSRLLLDHVRYLADIFSVRVVVLNDTWRLPEL